ncbi:MAG: hypothetical protein MJ059_08905 [Lachnospiraceae bacterium]|nr:hypothetical protein [Lachnospiraceae bacterium]
MSNFALTAILIVCIGLLVVIFAVYFDRVRMSLRNMKPLTVALLVLILLAAIVFLSFRLFGPRGEGSIFAENKEAQSVGTEDYNEESLLNQCLSEATAGNVEGDFSVYIKVTGERINIGSREFKDDEELKEFLGLLVRTDSRYVLVDDYASARTFENVRGVLESVGIRYTETAE